MNVLFALICVASISLFAVMIANVTGMKRPDILNRITDPPRRESNELEFKWPYDEDHL